MSGLIPDEACPKAPDGWHCDCWYEDEGCCHCGTQEPNLVILEGGD